MTTMGLDDTDMEFGEYDEGESDERWDDSEGEDQDAEGRSSRDRDRDRRRRAVQQRVVQARGRRELARGRAEARGGARGPTAPARTTPQQAVTAIRNLDLETKVQEDTFRRAITTQNKRMNRSDYAAVASIAINQAIESFDAPDNPYARAAARFSPLLLLSPQRKRPGLEGFVLDPRVMGGAAVLAITVLGENRRRFTLAREITISSPSELAAGDSDQLLADVLDARGKVLDAPVSWVSSNPDLAAVGPNGVVQAVKVGTAIITAEADGVVRRIRLKITPAAAAGGGR
jgi:hypothetical protein